MKKTIIFSFAILFLLSCRTELQTSQEYKKKYITHACWLGGDYLSHPVDYKFYRNKFTVYNDGSHWINPDSVSSIEITATVDSILRSGTVTKLKGDWYKKAFSCYWTIGYCERARLYLGEFQGEQPKSLELSVVRKKIIEMAENWKIANDTHKVNFLLHVIQPKYNIRYSDGTTFLSPEDKVLLIGYQHIINDPQRGMSFSDIDADFEYYYDGKDFYLLSNIAFHALDKYLKHKMGIKSILEEKLEKEKEEKKKKDSDTK